MFDVISASIHGIINIREERKEEAMSENVSPWQITGASVPGMDHVQPGKPAWKNNQDAFRMLVTERFSIGIVADGCGSGSMSELGAQFGSSVLLSIIASQLTVTNAGPSGSDADGKPANAPTASGIDWASVQSSLLGAIRDMVVRMGGSPSKTIAEAMLFSLVGFVMTDSTVTVFSCGDGFYAINGEWTELGPFPGNAPPYIAYRLCPTDALTESVIATVEFPAESVDSILVATDGLAYVPDFRTTIAEWLAVPAAFANPDFLRRKLAILNQERIREGVLVPGCLRDDTTIVVARKREKNHANIP